MLYLKRAICFGRIRPSGIHMRHTRSTRATLQPAKITFERCLFPDGNCFYAAIREIAHPPDQIQALRFGLGIEPKANALDSSVNDGVKLLHDTVYPATQDNERAI